MNPEKDQFAIRSILVTLDASPYSARRARAAAELAAEFGAELVGLFVEDINLLNLAALPIAREVSPFSSAMRQLNREQLQREFRTQSEAVRRTLAAAADARGVDWTFRVVRGAVTSAIIAEAATADLIILGRMTWPPAGTRRLGSTVRMILQEGQGLTMIVHEEVSFSVPVTLVFDGSELGEKALKVAIKLSKLRDGNTNVLILAPEVGRARQLQEAAREELGRVGLSGRFRSLIRPSLTTMTWWLETEARGPIVLPCSGELLQGETLCALVDRISNPVVLVR